MALTNSKVYCSAGIDYAVICPNGDVYRCMADYGANRSRLFNVKDGWHKVEKALMCSHSKCEASCDTRYTTKAIFGPNSDEPKIIGYEESGQQDTAYLRFPHQPVPESCRQHIQIVWLPTLRCNYTCKYCEYAAGRHKLQDIRSASPELSLEEWVGVWRGIYGMYDSIGLSVSGGEPLLSTATLPIINLLEDKCKYYDITSNLSVNAMGIMRHIGRPSLITASLHPTSSRFNKELFFGTLLCLKNNGFNVCVNFVGYPLQLFMAEEYKKWCDAHDIAFNVDYWCGGDHSGFFSKLSETEQQFMDKVTASRTVQFQEYNHHIETDVQALDIRQGSPFVIKGKVRNTGSALWPNKILNESDAFKMSLKVMRFGNENDILLDVRTPLPSQNILPGYACAFTIDVAGCLLSPETYLMKLDVLKDGPEGFWLEHRGADCKKIKFNVLKGLNPYKMVLDKTAFELQEGDVLVLKGKVKNTEDQPWLCENLTEEEAYKIGVRVMHERRPDEVLLDFRGPTIKENIFPGDWFDFEIKSDTTGFGEGTYRLKLDIVREGLGWFEQRGAHPVSVTVRLSQKRSMNDIKPSEIEAGVSKR